MFEFPTSFCKMWGNDPRRCLTLRLTSVLCFGSLWLLQGKLQLKFTTEKRSCPVSMVNRLELSCEITVLAMFSLNFWSLTEKKNVRLEDSIYKISNCIVCYHLTIRFRNERTMRMSFISLRTKEDAKEVLTVLSTLGKLER